MLPLTTIRRWLLAGRSRSVRWLRGALLVWLSSVIVVGLASTINGSASADDAPSPASSATRLAAVRFIVARSSPSAGEPVRFEVWVDGRRRVNGLAANIVSPYLLVGSGVRSFEVRSAGSVFVGEVRNVEGGSSTTFVATFGAGPAKLLGVPDSASQESPKVRLVNATSVVQALRVPGSPESSVAVAPFASSLPLPIPAPGEPSLQFEGRDVAFSIARATGGPKAPKDRVGSQLLVIVAAPGEAGGFAALSLSSARYPASMLPVDEGAPVSAEDAVGRPPEFWIRRLLAAIVLVLVVAATITTLRSFRVQSLHSRVRARME